LGNLLPYGVALWQQVVKHGHPAIPTTLAPKGPRVTARGKARVREVGPPPPPRATGALTKSPRADHVNPARDQLASRAVPATTPRHSDDPPAPPGHTGRCTA